MIARLRGEVIENNGSSVVVECHGVGYEVQVPATVAFQLLVGEPVDVYVRHVVREDDQTLYGFINSDQRRVFDLLREVKGCGPKISLAVLSALGGAGTLDAILVQDVKGLTRVSGIGPRLAERIIVELKDKVPAIEIDRKLAAVTPRGVRERATDEIVDALVALGYRRNDAEAAASEAKEQSDTVADQLKIALRSLAR